MAATNATELTTSATRIARTTTLSWISKSNHYSYPVYSILLIGTIGMFVILAICVAYCLMKAENPDQNPDNKAIIQEIFEQIYDFLRRRAYQQALFEYQYRQQLKRLEQQQQQQQSENEKIKQRQSPSRKPIKNPDLDRWIRKQMAEMEYMRKKQPVIVAKKPKLGKYVQSFISNVASDAIRRPKRPIKRQQQPPIRPVKKMKSAPAAAPTDDQRLSSMVSETNQQSNLEDNEDTDEQAQQTQKQANDQRFIHHTF